MRQDYNSLSVYILLIQTRAFAIIWCHFISLTRCVLCFSWLRFPRPCWRMMLICWRPLLTPVVLNKRLCKRCLRNLRLLFVVPFWSFCAVTNESGSNCSLSCSCSFCREVLLLFVMITLRAEHLSWPEAKPTSLTYSGPVLQSDSETTCSK